MTEKIELHEHELEFLKNNGKAVIEINLGEVTDECYLIDVFSVDQTDYVALISSDSNEIYIFYYEDSFENDEIDLKVIDDDLVEDYNTDIESFEEDDEILDDKESLDE